MIIRRQLSRRTLAKNIVEVLYPNDNHYAGKELRLKQQYFFISASLQTAVNKYKKAHHGDVTKMYEKVAFQMNDTHPSMAVAELMRILMDEERSDMGGCMGNHNKVLCLHQPHHHGRGSGEVANRAVLTSASAYLRIVEEINRRFVEEIEATYPGRPGEDRKNGNHL